MNEKSKKIIGLAIVLSLIIVGIPFLSNADFSFQNVEIQGLNTNTVYPDISDNGHVFLSGTSPSQEMVADSTRAAAWTTEEVESQLISVQATFNWNDKKAETPGGAFACGCNKGRFTSNDKWPVIAIGGTWYEVYMNGDKIIDTRSGLEYDASKVEISRYDDNLIAQGYGHKFDNIDADYETARNSWDCSFYNDRYTGGYWSQVKGYDWWAGSDRTIKTPLLDFYLKGRQTGDLRVLSLTRFAARDDNDGWGCAGGSWSSGTALIAEDHVKVESGSGSLKISSKNSEGVQSYENAESFDGGYSEYTTEQTSTTYPNRIFEEGETVYLEVTTGWTGSDSWTLEFWDAHGRRISDATMQLEDNLLRHQVTYKIPDNCFDASLGLNEFTIVLTNGIFNQGMVYSFVVDTKERLPGKATVSLSSESVKVGTSVMCYAEAEATDASGPIKKFRFEGRYDSPTGSLVFAPAYVNAYERNGKYKASFSFTPTQARGVYVMANALAGDNAEYPGKTSNPVFLTVNAVSQYYKIKFTIVDSEGEPVESAVVRLDGTPRITTSSGICEFTVDSGEYDISVEKSDYDTHTESIVVERDRYITIPLTGGPEDDGTNDGGTDDGTGGDTGEETEEEYTVTFTVKDAETSEMLIGASIGVESLTDGFAYSDTFWTDNEGKAILNLSEADYMFTIGTSGYQELSNSKMIYEDTTVNAQLWPDGETPEETDETETKDTKTITVVSNSQPLSNAEVSVFHETDLAKSWYETTDSSGTVSMQIPEDTYQIFISKTGYEALSETITITSQSSYEYSLTEKSPIDDDDSTTEESVGKTIIVQSESGTTIANAEMSVYHQTQAQYQFDGFTDSLGKFNIDAPEGMYGVIVIASGYEMYSDILTIGTEQEYIITLNEPDENNPSYDNDGNIVEGDDTEPIEWETGGDKNTIFVTVTNANPDVVVKVDDLVCKTPEDGKVSFNVDSDKTTAILLVKKSGYSPYGKMIEISDEEEYSVSLVKTSEGGGIEFDTPGFELFSLLIAFGALFILYKRRKK